MILHLRKTILFLALFLGTICAPQLVAAQNVVRVAAYPFPPFLNEDKQSGLTLDLIELLNESQNRFHFEVKITSPNRRYQLFKTNQVDMILFEMPVWGWNDGTLSFSETREIMTGGEKYITAALPGRDQSFFRDLTQKTISAHIGYHYGFANFNADQNWLNEHFKIQLHNSHGRIIDLVQKNMADIGVVNASYLARYLLENPQNAAKLLISTDFDQKYSMKALIRNAASIEVSQFEALLDQLKNSGKLQELFFKNGLEQQLTY